MKNQKLKPGRKELKEFSLIFGGLLSAIFGTLIPYLNTGSLNPMLICSGIGIIFIGLVMPIALYYPYKIWMFIGEVLGWINTRIILTIIFFFMFTPIGFMKRLFGSDSLNRRLDSKVDSYRILCSGRPAEHMERPF